MENSRIYYIINSAYGKQIATKLLASYKMAEESHLLSRWQECELSCSHFIESIRRILEYELFGSYTPYEKSLPRYNEGTIKKFETGEGHESFRLIFPRIVYGLICIRNKRGVGHVGEISPNEMDASMLFNSIKWCLAELVRLKSNISPEETKEIVNQIIERNVEIIWQNGTVKRILENKISARDQVLILLYNESPIGVDELLEIIEYKNKSLFIKTILKKLHAERFLEFEVSRSRCIITPKGIRKAEDIFQKIAQANNNLITI